MRNLGRSNLCYPQNNLKHYSKNAKNVPGTNVAFFNKYEVNYGKNIKINF